MLVQIKAKKEALLSRSGHHVTLLSVARGGAIHCSELTIAKFPNLMFPK